MQKVDAFFLLFNMTLSISATEFVQNSLAKIGLCRPQSVSFSTTHNKQQMNVTIKKHDESEELLSLFNVSSI